MKKKKRWMLAAWRGRSKRRCSQEAPGKFSSASSRRWDGTAGERKKGVQRREKLDGPHPP